MAKIPLRTYTKNIENLIERGEIEKAIAHAKNILQTYPKHIDTYRLLGKAYLENQRYAEAADILQRVLSAYPDDFVSHIGMSIIREDEHNQDAAIWHMERAYEVQPFNPAVQEELRRLYGRRDGVEPPKIRLTRGALVRMYARGELYQQAIAEIRAALAEDPQRLDLQVLLARMYLLAGQRVESIEVCSSLLNKLPYCAEANRILAEVLPGTSRAQDAEVFQQRLNALDPYEAFVSPAAPSSDQVPEQSVTVEEFFFDESGTSSLSVRETPEWTVTAGVQWEESAEPAENLPDWLNTLAPDTPKANSQPAHSEPAVSEPADAYPTDSYSPNDFSGDPFADAFQQEDQPATTQPSAGAQSYEMPAAQDDTLIPDWMKSAGWGVSDRSADEVAKAELAMQSQAEPLEAAPAEIPDWLQSVAPPVQAPDQEEERLDWLENILPGEGKPAAEEQPPVIDETPVTQSSAAEDTAWLSGLGFESTPAAPTEDMPEWLNATQDEAATPTQELEITSLIDSGAEQTDNMPDWLSQLGSEPEAAEADVPDWLAQTQEAAQQPETPETEITQPVSTQPAVEQTLPVEVTPTQPAEAPNFDDMDATMAWLESLAAKQGADEETLITRPEDRTDTPPDWITQSTTAQRSETVETAETEAQAEIPAELATWLDAESGQEELPVTEVPVITEPQPPVSEIAAPAAPDFSDSDAAMAWLESLAAKQGADEETLITRPEDRTDTPPDWVTQAAAQVSEPVETAAPELQAEIPDELPAWLDAESGGAELPAIEEPQAAATEAVAPAAPDFTDADAAMAWLESLAAKQGADEETLITRPEDRIDTPPDWIKQEMEAGEQPETPALFEASTEASLADLPWEESAVETPVGEFPAEATSVESGFAAEEAELPDWLQAMQPEEQEPAAELEIPESVDLPTQPTQVQMAAQPAEPVDEQPAAQETGQAPDFANMDMDAAMAWLESLAAKQGADEETLITRPEDRTDTPPDWVSQEVSAQLTEPDETPVEAPLASIDAAAEPQAETPEELPAWLTAELDSEESAAVEATQPLDVVFPTEEAPATAAAPDFSDADAAMAWLESLAAKQGADEETLITRPEDRTDTPPDWVTQEVAAMVDQPDHTGDDLFAETEQPPAHMEANPLEEVQPATAQAETAENAATDFDNAFAWLESLAANQGAQEGTLITDPENRANTPPDWIQQAASETEELAIDAEPVMPESPVMEQPVHPVVTPDELPVDAPVAAYESEPEIETEPLTSAPDWTQTPESQPSEWIPEFVDTLQNEIQPPAGETEQMPDWLQMETGEPAQEQPTGREGSLDDWLRGLESDNTTLSPSEPLTDYAIEWTPPQETFEPEIPAPPQEEITSLPEAQTALMRGHIDPALDCYNRFIQNGEKLDEVIHDLRDALYRYPVDINIWQLLGDAYARNNQLQEALDAYTKAEELLR